MRNPSSSHRDAPVTVTFPVPKKAASKLRTLAISKDRRLLDLGVLAVQINEGESIVLGIKLGRQRLKRTEVDSDKPRGSSSAGRVVKRHSTCRNAATIHHLPAASTHRLPAVKNSPFPSENVEENSRKRAVQPDGDVMGDELFSVLYSKTADKPSNDSKLRVSDYTNASVLSGNTEEQLTSSGSLPKKSRAKKPHSSGSCVTERSHVGSELNMQTSTPFAVRTSAQTPSFTKAAKLVTGQNDSSLPAARRLSSPASQRAYSASPCSDTSSTSSDEILDAQQLIYNCFVDTSKYSAADMLKQLAEAHERKKEATDATIAMTISSLPHAVKTSVTTAKPVSSSNSVSELPKSFGSSKRPAVPGSYREHVKNIRCNSLTSLTTSTSTVNSTLIAPTEPLTLGFQNYSSNVEKSAGFADVKPMTDVSQSKLSIDSQSKSITTGSNQTATYHRGRKVLWSSAKIFPNRSQLSPNLITNKASVSFPQVSSTSRESGTPLSQVQETVASPSIMKNDTAISDKGEKSIPSEVHLSVLESNKLSGQELVEKCRVMQSDSEKHAENTVIVKTPSLSFDSLEAVTASDAGGSQGTSSVSSPRLPGVTSIVQTESLVSKQFVQNLTLARSTLAPATVVLAGTNTQTTWSNQQVSPTYFVGAQGQYGIYPTLYSTTDVNNNQLGQQAMTATYPLNYVYPISFVYPYLSMAQASTLKNANTDKAQQQKEEEEEEEEVVKSDASGRDAASTVCEGKTEHGTTSQVASGNTVNVETTNTSTAPVQTQFIDLASSMRYWQQLSLLYRTRWQPLAACNPSNVAAVTSDQQANAMTTTSPTADHSSSTVTNGETTAMNSHSDQEQSFNKQEILQSNPSTDSCAGKDKPASNLFAEKPSSEILQRIKPEFSEENYSKDPSTGRPSVIVTAACSDGIPELPKSSVLDVKMESKQREFDDQALQKLKERRAILNSVPSETSPTSEDELCPPRLDCNQLRNMVTADSLRRRRFCGSVPKLSFIHDSSIARVNIGNNNGNGLHCTNHTENHPGVRRTCKF